MHAISEVSQAWKREPFEGTIISQPNGSIIKISTDADTGLKLTEKALRRLGMCVRVGKWSKVNQKAFPALRNNASK